MSFHEWGPFITTQIVLRNIAPAILTAALWATGHQIWLIANGKAPTWMVEQESRNFISNHTTQQYKSYLYKGIAWGINICWICVQLFISQWGDITPYKPIVGNVFLQDIGGAISLLFMFTILTSLYRWVTRKS